MRVVWSSSRLDGQPVEERAKAAITGDDVTNVHDSASNLYGCPACPGRLRPALW
jgi:hypothetical protein